MFKKQRWNHKASTYSMPHDNEFDAAQDMAQMEFSALMSLALDDELDAHAQAEFAQDLDRYPLLAQEWDLWQELDQKFTDAPAMEPPADFLHTFQLRLAQQERRQRLRIGIFIGAAVILLWVGLIAGAASLGAYVLYGQNAWISDLVQNLAYLNTVTANWVETLSTALGSVMGTPQARTFGVAYLSLVAAIVGMWTYFLRRNMNALDGQAEAQSA